MRRLQLKVAVLGLIFLVGFGLEKAQAQQKGLIGFGYQMGFPTQGMSDYISKNSFRGMSIDGRYFVAPRVSVGLSFGWNGFNEKKEKEKIEYKNGVVEGNQFRRMEAIPLVLTGHYYFSTYEFVRPYVGLGLGGVSVNRSYDLSLNTYGEDTWHFTATPELGLIVPIGYQGFALMANAKYNYMSKSGEFKPGGYLSTSFGVVLNVFE